MKEKAREEELQIAETKMVMHQVRRRHRVNVLKGRVMLGLGCEVA